MFFRVKGAQLFWYHLTHRQCPLQIVLLLLWYAQHMNCEKLGVVKPPNKSQVQDGVFDPLSAVVIRSFCSANVESLASIQSPFVRRFHCRG